MKKQTGFTLIELAAVLTIGIAIAALSMWQINKSQATSTFLQYNNITADELKQYAEAAEAYAPIQDQADSWANDTLYEVDALGMISNGYLPQNFAQRLFYALGTPQIGISPYNRIYRAYAIKSDIIPGTGNRDTKVSTRIIVTVDSNIPNHILRKVGYSGDNAELNSITFSIAENIAKKVQNNSEGKLLAGTIRPNVVIAKGLRDSFEYDLQDWITTPLSQARPVVFVNWPELGQGDDGNPGGNPIACRETRLLQNRTESFGTEFAPQCDTIGPGWTEIYNWFPCEATGSQAQIDNHGTVLKQPGNLPLAVGLSEIGNSLLTGLSERYDTATGQCAKPGYLNDENSGSPDHCYLYQQRHIKAVSSIGPAEVASQWCYDESYSWDHRFNPSQWIKHTHKAGDYAFSSYTRRYSHQRLCCLPPN